MRPDTDRDPRIRVAHVTTVDMSLRYLLLNQLVDLKSFTVNSLHAQGIDRLAPPLHADAIAPDGTLEAVSMPGAKGFLLGLQWHPEWRWRESEVSRAIFAAFGAALRKRAAS